MPFGYSNAFLISGGPFNEVGASQATERNRLATGNRNFVFARTPYVIDSSQALEVSFAFINSITAGVLSPILLDAGGAGTGTLGMWGDTALGQSNQLWTAFGARTGPIIATGTIADLDADDYIGVQYQVSDIGTGVGQGAQGAMLTLAGVYGSPGAIA